LEFAESYQCVALLQAYISVLAPALSAESCCKVLAFCEQKIKYHLTWGKGDGYGDNNNNNNNSNNSDNNNNNSDDSGVHEQLALLVDAIKCVCVNYVLSHYRATTQAQNWQVIPDTVRNVLQYGTACQVMWL